MPFYMAAVFAGRPRCWRGSPSAGAEHLKERYFMNGHSRTGSMNDEGRPRREQHHKNIDLAIQPVSE
jgi:hypothetical protein